MPISALGAARQHPGALSSDDIATWRAENVVDYLGQTEDVRRSYAPVPLSCYPPIIARDCRARRSSARHRPPGDHHRHLGMPKNDH